jgi:TolB-like protein/DNA-binding winged helix-turn-helix (wHTH) protein/tetratricopeptide (TPR) repeat protein
MDAVVHKVFRFEGFTLDAMRRFLRRGDREVELRPKSFEVLCYLVEHAGRLVTKNEIIDAVWPDVVVTDDSLTRCVSDVRAALGDGEQQIVKTMPRRGYLFVAPVSQIPMDVPMPPSTSVHTPPDHLDGRDAVAASGRRRAVWRWTPRIALAAVALLLIAVGAGVWFLRQPAGLPLPDRPSVAVLPFANLSGDSQQDYFSDGIAEDLTTSLSKFRELFVIAPASAFRYKDKPVDAERLGRELGVRYLLRGSVRRDKERLRITAQLVDAVTGIQLWAERYDREAGGMFAVQDEVTQKIVMTLVAHITRSELERALRKPAETLAAHDAYLRGNALLKNMQGETRGRTLAAARAFYEQAIAADPGYAPAVQGLANTYLLAWIQPSPDDAIGREFRQRASIDRAETLARRAVELDRTLAEAHATLGWILRWRDRQKEAIAAFERAFELNPNFADWRFAVLLAHGGRAADAIEYVKRIMRLDPFYPPNYTYLLGKAYFYTGQYEEAIGLIRDASVRLPYHRASLALLAATAALTGRNDEARGAATDLLRVQPDFTIGEWVRFLGLAKQEDADRLSEGLRRAGLPD